MIKISKMADYGTKILLAMTVEPEGLHTATELAQSTKVSVPTVSKILKILSRGQLLVSQRGSQGGYRLAKAPEKIMLVEIVRLLDGDIAMTECEHEIGCCGIESSCDVKSNWLVISQVINDVLRNISLAQMRHPLNITENPIKFYSKKVA